MREAVARRSEEIGGAPSGVAVPADADARATSAPRSDGRRSVRSRLALRAVAIVVHRYVGLVLTLFLVVAGLTGSVIAFYPELDAALNPELFRAPAPTDDARPLDPLEIRDRLQAKLPPGTLAAYLSLRHEPGRAASLYVEAPKGVDSVDNEYFVDPYSGQVLGSRRWGDVTQGKKNLMTFVYRLHYSLALDSVGILLFGIAALLWTLDCFVGAYLTFPPARRAGERRPDKSWLARWKPSWVLRTNKLFALVFTWHRASGLWVWAMLLVFAWSGVGLNLNEVYHPVMKTTFGMEDAYERLPDLKEPRVAPKLSWYEARALGRTLMAREAERRGFRVYEERRLSYDASHGVYRYQVRSSRDISERYAGTTIWLDGDTGRLVEFEAPTGDHAGNTITSWLYHLHFGTVAVGGLPYRIFVSAMGIVIALLSVTGVWIWLKKRRKQRAVRA